MNLFFRSLILLILLLGGFVALGIYWTFYKPLPDYAATIELSGIEEPVDIHWDAFGVPHIYSDNEEDLYYAVGYVHAQERLWQMTLSQLVAEGRFAEFLGEELIPMDIYQRTLGFWETAERMERELSSSMQQILNAYSRGVNDYVKHNRRNLPIEFTLTGVEPIRWTPTHSLAVSRLIAWEMNVGWWSKFTYGQIAESLTERVYRELYPEYDSRAPVMMETFEPGPWSRLQPLFETEQELRRLTQRSGDATGSNAWAVSGERTESGAPLLAGDPHMGLGIPGHWFELHLSSRGQNLSGGTIPGAPMVVLGQNDRLAWTLTNMMADDTDFFLERIHPEEDQMYLAEIRDGTEEWEPLEIREEVLRVAGSDDQLIRIRQTERGPLISDVHPSATDPDEPAISMSWTGHHVSHELEALYRMNWATSMEDFVEGIELFRAPGQNIVYADRDDNIAVFSVGAVPLRDGDPLSFREGWNPDHRWRGWIPFEELPRVVNPPSGQVANANNKLHGEDYPYYISLFWEPSSRIERIRMLLDENPVAGPQLFREMQMDTYSIHSRELVEMILPILRQSEHREEFREIMPYLENWNFRYDVTSTAASIMDAFFMHLTRNTLEDELGESLYEQLIRVNSIPTRIMTRLLREDSFLFNDETTEVIESRDQMIVQSMRDALDWLRGTYGEEPIGWQWEQLHTLTLLPPLLGEASRQDGAPRPLRLIVDNLLSKGPYPAPGHGMSLNKGDYSWNDPFAMNHGAAIRRIVDLSEPHRSETVLPTGQSGNPISEFYGDQTDLWMNGQYRYLYQDSTFFRETSYQTMRLIPVP